MAKKKITTPEPIDITPDDSVVPVYLIELTPDEIAERESWSAEQAKRETEETAKAEARNSALSKLAALGLTESEIAAIIG